MRAGEMTEILNNETNQVARANRIARAAVQITFVIAIAGWMFSVERNTARTATATEFIMVRLPILENGVSDNRELGSKNATRLDGVDKRLDEHQRAIEGITTKKGTRNE